MARLIAIALTCGGCLVLAQRDRGSLPDLAVATVSIALGILAAAIVRKRLDSLAIVAGCLAAAAQQVLASRDLSMLGGAAFVFVVLEAAEADRTPRSSWLRHAGYAFAAFVGSATAARYAHGTPLIQSASAAVAGLLAGLATFDAASFDEVDARDLAPSLDAPAAEGGSGLSPVTDQSEDERQDRGKSAAS